MATQYATASDAGGRWFETQAGPHKRGRYMIGTRKAGALEVIGLFAAVGTVFTADGRRHQRPFGDESTARQWVETNAT